MDVNKVMYDKDFVPKTVEELYNSGWKNYILYHIRKYVLYDVNNSPEDLLHDLMVQLLKTNYLSKFDPEKSEFTMYLYSFIKNYMSKPYNREHKTRNGGNIVNHASLVPTMNEAMESDNLVSHESLAGETGDFTDYVCLIQSLEADLEQIKSDSTVEYNGVTLSRDPLTVYKLFCAGYEVKDIAEMFGTSKQFIYALRKKILGLVESY